jgi:hypothetical protein
MYNAGYLPLSAAATTGSEIRCLWTGVIPFRRAM